MIGTGSPVGDTGGTRRQSGIAVICGRSTPRDQNGAPPANSPVVNSASTHVASPCVMRARSCDALRPDRSVSNATSTGAGSGARR